MTQNLEGFNRYFLIFVAMTVVIPSIYFLSSGIYLESPYVTLSIIATGWFGFYAGYGYTGGSSQKTDYEAQTRLGRFSTLSHTFLTLIVLLVCFLIAPIRMKYHIGVPDYPSTVRFSGAFYYMATYGLQSVLIALFLLSNKTRFNYFILFLGLMGYGVYEGFLGWRTGLLESLIILLVCRQLLIARDHSADSMTLYLNKLFRGSLIIVAVVITLVLVLRLQATVRDPGAVSSMTKIFFRFWGANFLDTTATYFIESGFGMLTNGNHFFYLVENGITAAEYNNIEIHGNAYGQHHGNSKTGFGSMYIYFGLLGVLAVFLATGKYFKAVYNRAKKGTSLVVSVAAILHFPLLFKIINEQYDLGTINSIIAIWGCSAISSTIVALLCRLSFRR